MLPKFQHAGGVGSQSAVAQGLNKESWDGSRVVLGAPGLTRGGSDSLGVPGGAWDGQGSSAVGLGGTLGPDVSKPYSNAAGRSEFTPPRRPKIVYPHTPGGTEIRPPAGPAPDSPPQGPPAPPAPPSHTPHPEVTAVPAPPCPGREVGGRDRFTPGDRVWWSVPELGEPDKDAAVKAGDWLVQIKVIMSDLSAGSGEWWQMLVDEAKAAYEKWSSAPAIERAGIKAIPSLRLQDERYVRLESRAFSMIHSSLPRSIKEELLATRSLTCLDASFVILKTFQPGGLAERSRLLDALSKPGNGANPRDLVDKLRAWSRHVVRATSMGVTIPDPSILMKGLDSLSHNLLGRYPQVNFRMSVVRTRLAIDHSPTEANVKEYAEALQSEFSMLAISAPEDQSQKPPRVAKLTGEEDPKGKGKGKDKKKGKPCGFWFTQQGCKMGQKCGFRHDQAVTIQSGRCFRCSGEGRRKEACPHADPSEKGEATKEEAQALAGKAKGKASIKKTGVSQGSGEGEGAAESSVSQSQGGAQAALLREATEALKKIALKATREAREALGSDRGVPGEGHDRWVGDGRVRFEDLAEGPQLRAVVCDDQAKGLLDSGALVCVRQAKPGELDCCGRRLVNLAVGSEMMYINGTGTIVRPGPVAPIVSMALLVRAGYKLRWVGDSGLELKDRKGRRVPADMSSGCPEVPKAWALSMIEEIEQVCGRAERVKRAVKVLRDVTPQDPQELLKLIRERAKEGGSTEGLVRAWLGLVVPEAPDELLDRTAASVATRGETWAWNRRKRRQLLLARNGVLLNLFAGSTRQCFQAFADRNHMALLDIDLQEDLALEQTFSSLLSLALCGRIKILLAGPPCRTYSVLRSRPGGPPVVRAREGPERWGLEGIPWIEAQKVEGDNVLWVRTAALLYAAKDSNEVLGMGPLYGLVEQPRDAVEYRQIEDHRRCPCLLATKEWKDLQGYLGWSQVNLNQGPLGHARVKPTTIGTNLPLQWLTVATSGVQASWTKDSEDSREWGAWAPGLVKSIIEALQESLDKDFQCVQIKAVKHSDEEAMRRHLEQGHVPYWRRCRACVEGRSRDKRHCRGMIPDVNVLAIDLAGLFRSGYDERISKVKYMLQAVFVLPDLKTLKTRDQSQDPKGHENPEAGGLQNPGATVASGADAILSSPSYAPTSDEELEVPSRVRKVRLSPVGVGEDFVLCQSGSIVRKGYKISLGTRTRMIFLASAMTRGRENLNPKDPQNLWLKQGFISLASCR